MSLPTATFSFLSPVFGVIPPSDPPTCQVEIEDPGKAYEAVIGSLLHIVKTFGSPVTGT